MSFFASIASCKINMPRIVLVTGSMVLKRDAAVEPEGGFAPLRYAIPPLIDTVCPLMYPARSEHRNATSGPYSAGIP